jgi:hypothetical protein
VRISARFRLGLAAKGLLLLALGALFVALWLRAGLVGTLFFSVPAVFCLWTAALAFADAARGEAVIVSGAVALRSRRSGVSFRLPNGRSAEFLLYNPWSRLVPDATYEVTIGRHSHVLVAPPMRELSAPPRQPG